ncbi:Mul1p [Trebouxia sp. C0010 RCD-2024]
MNVGGATARQYELVGTQKESKALLLGTQLHAFGEVATTRDGRVVLRRPRNDKPFIVSDMPRKEIIAQEKFTAQLCKANAWLAGSVGLLLLGSQVVQLGRVIWKAKVNWVWVMDQFCLTNHCQQGPIPQRAAQEQSLDCPVLRAFKFLFWFKGKAISEHNSTAELCTDAHRAQHLTAVEEVHRKEVVMGQWWEVSA